MNLYLLSYGYPIVSLKGDNQSKQIYYKTLEISHIDNNPIPFYEFVAENVKLSLENHIRIIKEYGLIVKK